MPNRRHFLKLASAAAITSALATRTHAAVAPDLGAVSSAGLEANGLKINIG